MKRVGIAQIWQESNSFNPVPTTPEHFHDWDVVEGPDVITRFGDAEELGGFLSHLARNPSGFHPVGLLRAIAWPGGPLAPETLEWLLNAFRRTLSKAPPLDGLLFSLHGALVAEDEPDVDGRLLEIARHALPAGAPVVATLDCHAHLTPRMSRNADVLVAYHTSPHLDRRETGVRAARVLDALLAGAQPASASVRLPMIVSGEMTNTFDEVLSPVFEKLKDLETRKDVLSAAVLMTQPWLDVPSLGWSTLVTTNGKADLAKDLAADLADMCWSRHDRLASDAGSFRTPDDAVADAVACPGKPVILADGPDATNSGAPGDSTHLLRAMIARDVPEGALTIMVDPEAVAHAASVGPGGAFDFPVGGKRDNRFSTPLPVTGRVLSVRPARYTLSGHAADNLAVDMGTSAAVRIRDVTLLLVTRPGPGSSPLMYRCVDLEPRDFKIVVVKSPAGFRADFGPFAAHIILTDSPGCARPRFDALPYAGITRPLWPFDEIGDYRSVPWTRTDTDA